MKNISIMYEDRQRSILSDCGYDFTKLITDLNLSELAQIVKMPETDMKIVYAKLIDFNTTKEDIHLRHSLINDFLCNTSLFGRFDEQIELFKTAAKDMLEAKKLAYKNNDNSGDSVNFARILSACHFLNLTYKIIYRFYTALDQLKLHSSKLQLIFDYLNELVNNSPLKILSQNCTALINLVDEGIYFDVDIKFNSILRMISMDIQDFRFKRPDSKGVMNMMLKKFAPERKSIKAKPHYRIKHFYKQNVLNIRDDYFIKTVFNSGLNMIAKRIVNIYEGLMDTFMNLADELVFYKFAVKLIQFYNSQEIPYSYATLLDSPDYAADLSLPKIHMENLYDLSLLHLKSGEYSHLNIVNNNFHLNTENNINIIMGNNQSGKTSFIRALGSALIFARSGLPLPATEAKIFLFSRLYTHFERFDEEVKNEGQLDMELGEMESIVYSADNGSILIMNESFSSTGVKDAMAISVDVMSAFSHIGATVLFVTHLPQMTANLKESPNMKSPENILLFKTGADKDGAPTYKLVRE